MRNVVGEVFAAAVLVAGAVGLFGACSHQSTAEPPVGPPASSAPSSPLPTPGARPPLGLEIRHVDAQGKVVILEPGDFPR